MIVIVQWICYCTEHNELGLAVLLYQTFGTLKCLTILYLEYLRVNTTFYVHISNLHLTVFKGCMYLVVG